MFISFIGYLVVSMGSSSSLRRVDCNILYQRVRTWGAYMSMFTLTNKTHFGVIRGCQEQIREVYGPK
jgi:hypothetical protein